MRPLPRPAAKALVPAAALLLLGACTTLPRDVRQDGTAGFAQGTRAGPLVIRPDQLDEDSRCPVGTQCVWAGIVQIEATYWHGGKPTAVRMMLGQPVKAAGGTLVLDKVRPERKPHGRIRPEQYRFHFTWKAD